MYEYYRNSTFSLIIVTFLMLFGLQLTIAPLCHGFDRQHDTGHRTSGQEGTGPDNPNGNNNGDDGKDPVELLTGNFRYQHEDMAMPSGPGRLELSRHYNNQDRYNGPLGYGWNFSFNMKIMFVKDDQGQEFAVVRDDSGRRFTFTRNNDGSFTSPDGWFMKLVADGQGGYDLTKSCGKTFSFDADGDLTRIGSCCEANRLDLAYDNDKRLTTLSDTYGNSFTFTYNDNHKIVSVQDSAGRAINYSYDNNENLIEFQGLNGDKLRYNYDDKHNLTGELNGMGEVLLTNSYDDKDRVASQTYSEGTFTFSYDSTGRVVTIRDSDNNTEIHKVNEFGQPLEITDALGKTEYYTWDAFQRLTSYTNRNGQTATYEYDANGNRTRLILGDGRQINITYNSNNRATVYTDLGGNTTTFDYNNDGTLTRKTYPSGTKYLAKTYNANGQMTGVYNALPGNSAANPMYQITYNDSGQVSQVTYQDGTTEQFFYNSQNRIDHEVKRNGEEIYYGYNQAGLITNVNYKVGNSFQIHRFTYNAQGQMLKYIDPAGETTSFGIDRYGRLTSVADPLNNTTSYTYSKDRIATRADANNNTTSYTYDAAGNLTKIDYPDGSSVAYTYDFMGRLTSADDGTVSVSFSYEIFGQVTQMQVPYLQKTVDFNYDNSGRNTGMTVTDAAAANQTSTFAYSFDADGLLTGVTAPDSSQATKTLDTAGRPTTITYSNGMTEERTYNSLTGRLEQILYKKNTTTLEDIQYTYNTEGNITSVDRNSQSTTYEYDDLNRLIRATLPDGTVHSYTYDQRDNRLTAKTGSNPATVFTYDKAGRLISDGTYTYTYDNNGNLTVKTDGSNTTTYVYDYENRLTSVTLPDSTVVSYRYYPTMPDSEVNLFALGEQLISKAVNGTDTERYLLGLDMDPIMTLDNTNAMTAWHSGSISQDDIYLSSTNGGTFHLRDILSSVVSQADSTGIIGASFSYAPYGKPLSATPQPFGFTGRAHQPQTGLIYYRARFYNPDLGRFISKDYQRFYARDARRFNLYAYVLNNPAMLLDPTGHKDKCPGSAWTGFVVGTEAHLVFGASISSINVCCTARPSLCCSFGSFAVSAGVEASASAGAAVIQFLNCPDAGGISGWGGGVSGEIAVGGGVDAGASIGTSGCGAIQGGGGAGVGGGVSVDFGYTWSEGCTY